MQPSIDLAGAVLTAESGIRVRLTGIQVIDEPAPPRALDPRANRRLLLDDVLGRTEFYRRHSAPVDLATAVVGAPVTVVVVRNIAGRVTGCSLGISADWVIVQASLFDRTQPHTYDETVLVHELGHALNLPHFRDRQNLMFPASSPPGTCAAPTCRAGRPRSCTRTGTWCPALPSALTRRVLWPRRSTAAWPDRRSSRRGTIRVDRCSPGPARPALPSVPGSPSPLRLYDTATAAVRRPRRGRTATMYVCGITPYDATHLGHAATYMAFDLVQRVWLDNGHRVHYVQNITDIDDPLLERARPGRHRLARSGGAARSSCSART